jgi:ribosomal-protein-alanine N-acetyltransferase
MKAPTFRTERLVIRPLSNTDVDDFVSELASDSEIMANLFEDCPTTAEQKKCATDYIEGYSSLWQTHHYGGWAVCARISEIAEPGKLLGYLGFGPGDLNDAGAELSYAYWRSYWGKGVGTEAARACMKWYFITVGYDRCYVCHHSWNDGSTKIIEKLGFVYSRDEDLWGSVEKGDGLLPTYLLDKATYLKTTL